MDDLNETYVTTTEAAAMLSMHPDSMTYLLRRGTLPAVKIAYRWLIPRAAVEELAKTYVPKRGHPRVKRKYTKRSPKWYKTSD